MAALDALTDHAFFVEQLDRKQNVAGGLAVVALSSRVQVPDPVLPALFALSIPVSIPSRPSCTFPAVELRMLDSLFVAKFGFQPINAEIRNDSNSTLENASIYIEGFSDPKIDLIGSGAVIPGSPILPSPSSSKAVLAADFKDATLGETRVAFVVQQIDGISIKKVRIIKKILYLVVTSMKQRRPLPQRLPKGPLSCASTPSSPQRKYSAAAILMNKDLHLTRS